MDRRAKAQWSAMPSLRLRPGKTTVLIPTYQRAAMLDRCLRSVITELEDGDEVCVVSDGSTDSTPDVVRAFGAPVFLMEKRNGGRASAINHGLSHVRTEFVWMFDDDDVVLAGGMRLLAESLSAQPGHAFCVAPWEYAVDDPVSMHIAGSGKTFVPSSLHERGTLPPLFEANYLCGAGMFARTAAIQALGGLDERYHRSQDYHLGIRAALQYRFHVVPCGPTFLYSQHDGRRGPRAERFAFQQSTRRWLKYDQMIFFELIDPLPLSAFREPTDQDAEADALAYVNRARAAASKHLPFRTIEALIDRCIRFPDLGPTRIESIRIRDLVTMGSWYGLGSIADDRRFWIEVATLRQAGAAGRCIADLLFQSRPSIARRTFRRIRARLRYGA